MQLLLLHLDDALELQPDFVHSCQMAGAHEVDDKDSGRAIRLWGRRPDLDTVWRNLAKARPSTGEGARLCFMGSGDFHHVTALLLSQALENSRKAVTVIHIDNHPDWVHFDPGMHCGSWVNKALEQPLVKKVITLGVCSRDLRSPERKGANLVPLSDGRLELYPYEHPPSKVKSHYGSGRVSARSTAPCTGNRYRSSERAISSTGFSAASKPKRFTSRSTRTLSPTPMP